MTVFEALSLFISLVVALIGLLAAYLQFAARPGSNLSDKQLDKKLRSILSSGEKNHTRTKHLRTIQRKLRGIEKGRLDEALRRVATSGTGSDGKETWTLD